MEKYTKLIYNFMEKHKLTQAEMAQRLNITPATLSRWLSEINGITPRNKKRIEFLCGIRPVLPITDRLIAKLRQLSEEDQWKAYDLIIKHFNIEDKTDDYKIPLQGNLKEVEEPENIFNVAEEDGDYNLTKPK